MTNVITSNNIPNNIVYFIEDFKPLLMKKLNFRLRAERLLVLQ